MRMIFAGIVAALVSFASTVHAAPPAEQKPTPSAQPSSPAAQPNAPSAQPGAPSGTPGAQPTNPESPEAIAAANPTPTLVAVDGDVLVNGGNGFEKAQPGHPLKPGDQVVVNPGARAQIMYPQGCLVPVKPGQIMTVVAKPDCAALTTGVVPAVVAPVVAGAGAGAGITTATVVGTTAAAAGGGAAAIAYSKNQSSKAPEVVASKPASP